jgi:tetratricopeptide (TPR) repeat protein
MNKFLILNTVFFLLILTFKNVEAKDLISFDKGKKLYEIEKYDEAKIFFERDIVFNPKEYKSYLYLAKIYNIGENDEETEKNLNNVLLLNPNNDEAIYLLILIKIKQSDYSKSSELIEKFVKVCNLFCSKEKEIKSKLEKINPDNEK